MPYDRPGRRYYATATKEVNHGAPVTEDGFVGVAIKQRVVGWEKGLVDQNVIAVAEDFIIKTKGIVQIADPTGVVVGDPLYITAASNAITKTAGAGKLKFGVVHEVSGERGTPAAKVRVDLDAKDSF